MANINVIIGAIRNMIEADFKSYNHIDEDWTIVTNISEIDGHSSGGASNKIVISVPSIQMDVSVNNYNSPRPGDADAYAKLHPAVYMDVYMLLASTFAGNAYGTGLDLLSRVIGFFQERPTIGAEESPEIGEEMGRLAIEFVNLDFVQAGNLSTLTGLKGFPFLLYRLRRVPFESTAIAGVAAPIRATGSRPPPTRWVRRDKRVDVGPRE